MKKTIVKILSVTLALTLVMSFAACSKNNQKTITDVTTKGLDALIAYDTGKIDKYVSCPSLDDIRKKVDAMAGTGADKAVAALFAKMTYTFGEIVINEEPGEGDVKATATVEATITNKDLQGDAAKYVLSTITKLKNNQVDLTDSNYVKGEVDKIIEFMNSDAVVERATAVTFNLEKGKSGWKLIVAGNAESAVFSRALTSVNSLLLFVEKAGTGELNFGSPDAAPTTAPAA